MTVAFAHAVGAREGGRPSVGRVVEIGMRGLRGGFRNPGPQGHCA
jgi:hypothetical protein